MSDTTVSCQCNHLTDFAITMKKTEKRMSNIFSKPLDAFKVHWIVPFTLAMIFAFYVLCTIICAFWDVYVGRRFKMGARGFMTVLAYVRMRRLMYRKRWSKLQEADRRSGRFSQNFVPTNVVNEEIRSSKLVIRFKKHQTELRFSDFLWKEFKVKHDILAFFSIHICILVGKSYLPFLYCAF